MKVGWIVPGFSADGADWCIPVLVDTVRELSRQADVHIFALRYPYRWQNYRLHGAHIHALGGGKVRGVRRGLLLSNTLRSLVAEHWCGRFNVLHGLWADEPGFVAAAAGRVLGIPAVVSVMGGELVGLPDIDYGGNLSRSNRALTAFALRTSSSVTTASSQGMTLVQSILGARSGCRLEQLVWGIDPSLFASRSSPLPLRGGFRLLHVGSLIPVKDQAMLLHAFQRVRAVHPAAHLHIVGDGPMRQALESVAVSLGLAAYVTFHGHVRREELAAYYRACHALVISSRHEMQPVVALEAALCGLPIVGCDVGVIQDLAPDAAVTATAGDDQALADALLSLVSKESRHALAATAYDRIRSTYLASHTADRLMALYTEVQDARREAAAGPSRQNHVRSVVTRLGEPSGE